MRKNNHFFAFSYAVMVLKSDFVKRIKGKTSIRVNLIEDKIKHHHQSNNGLWHEQHSNIIKTPEPWLDRKLLVFISESLLKREKKFSLAESWM